MNKQRKKKVFLNFKGNSTEVVFTILFKNEQRASADHGEIIKQYSTAMSKSSGTISRILGEKKKDFMRHRKGTFYNFLKNTTNALCLDCAGHHSLYNSCKRGADHLSLPPWTRSGRRGRELRAGRAQPGLTPQLRVWGQGWCACVVTVSMPFSFSTKTLR